MNDVTYEQFGMVEVRGTGTARRVGDAIQFDFHDTAELCLDLNGREYGGRSAGEVAAAVEDAMATRASGLLAFRLSARPSGDRRLRIEGPPELLTPSADAALVGRAAAHAIEKAQRVIADPSAAWPSRPASDPAALARLDGVLSDGWGGPLIVSMPRTGSTLLGTMLLLLRDPPGDGEPVFDRYIHEPVAPVFWQGRSVDVIREIAAPGLTSRDIVQESAYQFADGDIARRFLEGARRPVVFLLRHPQLAWPSRWRVMLSMMRTDEARRSEWGRIDRALEANDFRDVGDLLTHGVRPADNGWFSLLALLDRCRRDGIDHVIVDNSRFRDHPERTLRGLCARWGLEYDDRLTTWSDLTEALPRVVMGDMARTEEYPWYYERTMSSSRGILPADDSLLDPARVPRELRGARGDGLTLDEATTWYRIVLANPATLG